jgi:hypothetical protein
MLDNVIGPVVPDTGYDPFGNDQTIAGLIGEWVSKGNHFVSKANISNTSKLNWHIWTAFKADHGQVNVRVCAKDISWKFVLIAFCVCDDYPNPGRACDHMMVCQCQSVLRIDDAGATAEIASRQFSDDEHHRSLYPLYEF